MKRDLSTVSFGWTSVIGYLSAAAAAIPIIVEAIERGTRAFSESGWLGLYVVVATAVTTLIRGYQAGKKLEAPGGARPPSV